MCDQGRIQGAVEYFSQDNIRPAGQWNSAMLYAYRGMEFERVLNIPGEHASWRVLFGCRLLGEISNTFMNSPTPKETVLIGLSEFIESRLVEQDLPIGAASDTIVAYNEYVAKKAGAYRHTSEPKPSTVTFTLEDLDVIGMVAQAIGEEAVRMYEEHFLPLRNVLAFHAQAYRVTDRRWSRIVLWAG